VGLYTNIGQVAEWIRYRQIVRPDPNAHRKYQPYYEIYRQLYLDTAGTVHRLARMQ
jgi:sugar (pentulose or hexulose) kinase